MISGAIVLLIWLVCAAIGLLLFVFWIWMLVDCIKSTALESTEKIIWALVIIFLHALGALIYFLVGRKGGR